MHRITQKILLFSIIFFLVAKIVIMAVIFYYPVTDIGIDPGVDAEELITMTNNYREAEGLSDLSINPRLTQAAVNKAGDILTNQYFNHTSPSGRKFSDWIKEVGYKYFYVGENLAIDFDNNSDVFTAWLNSPTHKENIIKPQYQEIGIATLTGNYNHHLSTVVVQLFGTRMMDSNESGPALPLKDLLNVNSSYSLEEMSSLKNIKTANHWNDLVLIIIIALYLATYYPKRSRSQIINNKPRAKR